MTDLGWCTTARHFAWSFTTSCQLVTPTRSLLITSIHRGGVPPGLLLFPCGLHLRSCFWGRWSGIHCTWPSHCSRLCLSCSSTGNSPVSLRMSTCPRTHTHTHTHKCTRGSYVWTPAREFGPLHLPWVARGSLVVDCGQRMGPQTILFCRLVGFKLVGCN